MLKLWFVLFSLLILCIVYTAAYGENKILLKSVQALTFYSDRMTTGRRSAPIKQMSCIGGNGCHQSPEVIQCQNSGFDGHDVQWKCQADLPSNVKFGKIEVVCEGYDYPDDPYILVGSCGIEYTLISQDNSGYHNNNAHYNTNNYGGAFNQGSSGRTWVTWIVLIVVAYVVYTTCVAGQQANNGYDDNSPHGPGGSGARAAPHYPQPPTGPQGYNYNTGYAQNCGANANGYGGFWNGLMTGGLLGYMFGRPRGYGYGYNNYGYNNYGGYGARPTTTYTAPSFNMGSSFRSASGFGGTRRR